MAQTHRENETHPLKPIDVLLVETGVQEVKVQVQGLVHRLLDRKEWIGHAFVVRKMGLSMPVLGLNLRFSERLMFSPGLGEHPIPFAFRFTHGDRFRQRCRVEP